MSILESACPAPSDGHFGLSSHITPLPTGCLFLFGRFGALSFCWSEIVKEDFKEEGLLLTRQSPMGPAEGFRDWWQWSVGCCRESIKPGDDWETWACLESGVNRETCCKIVLILLVC